MNNLVDKIFKLDRLTILNIILGLLIAITPVDYMLLQMHQWEM